MALVESVWNALQGKPSSGGLWPYSSPGPKAAAPVTGASSLAEASAAGRVGTILTSGQGDTGSATLAKKQLLGG